MGPVTQGGSRCAPLPWATFALPLRGGRWSLLMSADNMRSMSTSPNKIAAPNRRLRLGAVPWSFWILQNQGPAVGELGRSLNR